MCNCYIKLGVTVNIIYIHNFNFIYYSILANKLKLNDYIWSMGRTHQWITLFSIYFTLNLILWYNIYCNIYYKLFNIL